MTSNKAQCQHPKHYSKIGLKRRQRLVDLVLLKNYSIGRAARRFKIKLSTAKMIVKKYKEQGVFFEKKGQAKNQTNSASSRKDVIQQKTIDAKAEFIEDAPVAVSHEIKQEQDSPQPSNFENPIQNQHPQVRFLLFEPYPMNPFYCTQGFMAQATPHYYLPTMM